MVRAPTLYRTHFRSPAARTCPGEFNSGKSSIINALLGEDVVAEGVTPTTSEVCVVGHGDGNGDGDGDGAAIPPLSFLADNEASTRVR